VRAFIRHLRPGSELNKTKKKEKKRKEEQETEKGKGTIMPVEPIGKRKLRLARQKNSKT